jgi:transposase
MSLHPQAIPPVPEETARVARASLPKGNTWIHMRDEFGTFFRDETFLDLFSEKGQPAESAWRLALVMVMHYAEGLTDRQAADAVKTRIDGKYALRLEITDPGFDFSVLSEFRGRLLTNQAERRLFEVMLSQCARARMGQRARQTTTRFHPREGPYPSGEPSRMRWRNDASCAQYASGSRSRLAPRTDAAGMGQALSITFQRLSLTQRRESTKRIGRRNRC